MFAAVNSPWSANEVGEPIVILVEAPDKDSVPELLSKAIAMEAHRAGQIPAEEEIAQLVTTLSLMD